VSDPRLLRTDPLLGLVQLCRGCDEEWPADEEFWWHARWTALRLDNYCRACRIEARRGLRDLGTRQRARKTAWQRRRRKDPTERAKATAYIRRRRLDPAYREAQRQRRRDPVVQEREREKRRQCYQRLSQDPAWMQHRAEMERSRRRLLRETDPAWAEWERSSARERARRRREAA